MMLNSLRWLLILGGTAIIGGAIALWLHRAHAIMIDLSTSISSFLCI